jgi:hypothetical protein
MVADFLGRPRGGWLCLLKRGYTWRRIALELIGSTWKVNDHHLSTRVHP